MPRLLVLGALLFILIPVVAPASTAAVTVPADQLRGTGGEIYFEPTGHHLSGEFLDFWQRNGGLDIFGFPVSEPVEASGVLTQYLERARFELHPGNPPGSRVLLSQLARSLALGRPDAAFAPVPPGGSHQDSREQRYFPESGHFLSYSFKSFWEQNGGLAVFGYPISEEFQEGTLTVQYFERARFEFHHGFHRVQLASLGTAAAKAAGVSLEAVAKRPGSMSWLNSSSTTQKWIEVSLSVPQVLIAWEGDTPVFVRNISGGASDSPTVTGTFEIYWKLESQRMLGGIPGTAGYYDLPGVPWVMYFFADFAFHGAYWHSSWGLPVSHGCINLSPTDAAWLYHWAPMGTKVWIHD